MVILSACLRHMWVHTSRCLKTCGCQMEAHILVLTRRSLVWCGAGSRIDLPILKAQLPGGKRESVKLLYCRSRTYPMQPLPPCMPNVRRWRGLGGCGPRVCHPSDGAAGDGTRSLGPDSGWNYHCLSVAFHVCPLAVAENIQVPWVSWTQ